MRSGSTAQHQAPPGGPKQTPLTPRKSYGCYYCAIGCKQSANSKMQSKTDILFSLFSPSKRQIERSCCAPDEHPVSVHRITRLSDRAQHAPHTTQHTQACAGHRLHGAPLEPTGISCDPADTCVLHHLPVEYSAAAHTLERGNSHGSPAHIARSKRSHRVHTGAAAHSRGKLGEEMRGGCSSPWRRKWHATDPETRTAGREACRGSTACCVLAG